MNNISPKYDKKSSALQLSKNFNSNLFKTMLPVVAEYYAKLLKEFVDRENDSPKILARQIIDVTYKKDVNAKQVPIETDFLTPGMALESSLRMVYYDAAFDCEYDLSDMVLANIDELYRLINKWINLIF